MIDGFNLITTIEAALSGGVLIRGRDGALRDMASMHGSYRKVRETLPALQHIGETLRSLDAGPCDWVLDRPVSNAGRLKTIIDELASDRGYDWQARTEYDPDKHLKDAPPEVVVVTSDSAILDRCHHWLALSRCVVDQFVPNAWTVDLSQASPDRVQDA